MSVNTLYFTNYFNSDTLCIRACAQIAGKDLKLCEINKKYEPNTLYTQEGTLTQPGAILRLLASGTVLESDFNQTNQWFQFINMELLPLLREIYAQIFGQKQPKQKKYNYAVQELWKVLRILDESLKMKTFFVGDRLSTVDLAFVCHLQNALKLVISESQRKNYPNLMRWHKFVRAIPAFITTHGKSNLCGKQSFKVEFKTTEQIEQKSQKTEQQTLPIKTQFKDEKAHPVQAQQKQAGTVSSFNLENFKRDFQNNQNKDEIVQRMLEEFDSKNWSIWKVHYEKDVTEGKIEFLTNNLASGSFQRLDPIRKYSFGSWGVYGGQGDYEIRGLFLWKGTEIAEGWKDHPSYEYHKFWKLDPSSGADRQIIFDYLLQRKEAEGLKLCNSMRMI